MVPYWKRPTFVGALEGQKCQQQGQKTKPRECLHLTARHLVLDTNSNRLIELVVLRCKLRNPIQNIRKLGNYFSVSRAESIPCEHPVVVKKVLPKSIVEDRKRLSRVSRN